MNTYFKLLKESGEETIAQNALLANSFKSRFFGLMNSKDWGELDGLILTNSKMIHMFWMRFCIDLLFCNADNQIITIQKNLAPRQISKLVLKADYIIELPAGTVEKSDLNIGDRLVLREL